MKKILISLTIAIFSLTLPYIAKAELVISEEPHDYKKGLLDDNELINSNDLPINFYDNNVDDKNLVTPNTDYLIEFAYPVNITGSFIKYERLYSNAYFTFVGGESAKVTIRNWGTDGYNQLDYKNVTKIELERTSDGNLYIYELDFFGSYEKDVIVYDKAHTLKATATYNTINLNWINPHLEGFKNVLLYVNGELKETLGKDITSYQLRNLEPETSYQIELIALYENGGKSEKEILSVLTEKILPEKKEIQQLRAKATHERVNLSWQLPIIKDDFNHVNIYRGQEKEEIAKRTLFTNVANAEEPLQKIFETNGTYFNDLTVEPDTTYNYKLTVSEINGIETSGISTRVTTAPEPPPEIENLIITKPTDDGYLLTWETPTENDMEIIVGGNLYDKVPASDKEYFIPFEDVPLDMFGNPQIELIATKPDGQKSKPTRPIPDSNIDNIKLPFTIQEVLTTIMEIIRILAPIILLALAIKLTPKLINLIRKVAENKKRG